MASSGVHSVGRFHDEVYLQEDLVKFLIELCRDSDEKWNGKREYDVDRHYQKARELIKRAGYVYRKRRK